MTLGRLTWNATEGEGHVRLAADFDDADRVVQLDALIDWIAELRDIYEDVLANPGKKVAMNTRRTMLVKDK